MATGDGTPRTYNISNETSNGSLVGNILLSEINSNENIVNPRTIESINTDDNVCNIYFDAALSESEITELDIVLASHKGDSSPELVLKGLTLNNYRDHRGVNYKTELKSRLHKEVSDMYRGEVREVNYFTDETKTTLVLKVQVFSDEECTTPGYSRNSLGQPVERWTKRTWYKEDGSAHPETKITHKVYTHDNVSQMREGIRRRNNTIDKLMVDVLRAYVFTTAVDPMNPTAEEMTAAYNALAVYTDGYEAEITTFIRVGSNSFLTPPASPNVTDDTETWLDNSVVAMGYPAGWTVRTILLEGIKNISDD